MEIEDYNLIIDSSDISEVAKFTALKKTNAYISIIPNNNPTNCARIGVESNNMYFGLVTNNNFNKLLELNNSNLISHSHLVPSSNVLNLGSSDYSYSNIYCKNIYTNDLILKNIFNIKLEINSQINISEKTFNYNNSPKKIPFIPIISTSSIISQYWNNNYFTVPFSGIYSINYSLYSDNNNNNISTMFINKNNTYQNISDNNYGFQTINNNKTINNTSITLLLNKNDTIYFCIVVNTNNGNIIINPDSIYKSTASITLINMTN